MLIKEETLLNYVLQLLGTSQCDMVYSTVVLCVGGIGTTPRKLIYRLQLTHKNRAMQI